MTERWMKLLPVFLRRRLEDKDVQRVMGNTGWLFADKFLRMGVGLLVGVWVARYLGPQNFGIMSYAGAFVALFGAIAGLGLDGVVVRDLVSSPSERNEILGTAFILKLAGGFCTLLLAAGSILLVRPGEVVTQQIVLILAAGTLFQSFDVMDYYFQSRVSSKYTVIAKNSAFLCSALVRLSLVLGKASLVFFALANVSEVVLGALGLATIYKSKGNLVLAWRFSLAKAASLLKISWPLILSGLSIIVYMKIDQIMLGNMIGDSSVGIYSAAVRISELWYFVPASIYSSVLPSIIEAKALDAGLYHRRLQRLFSLMSAMALMVAIPMTFLSKYIVVILFGKGYVAAGPILSIHIWTALFVFLSVAQGAWDLAEGLTKLSLFRTASGAAINIILNLILIPRFSVLGAAIATVISQAFSGVILNLVAKRTRIIFWYQLKSLLFYRPAV